MYTPHTLHALPMHTTHIYIEESVSANTEAHVDSHTPLPSLSPYPNYLIYNDQDVIKINLDDHNNEGKGAATARTLLVESIEASWWEGPLDIIVPCVCVCVFVGMFVYIYIYVEK